jgi:hypothetical protein
MTKANFSNKNLGAGGAIIISAWLTHKDNGAISYEMVTHESLVAFHQEHDPQLVGHEEQFLRDFTTKDLLNECQGAYGAVPEVTVVSKAKGAMTSLNLASNNLGAEGAKIITAVLPKCT